MLNSLALLALSYLGTCRPCDAELVRHGACAPGVTHNPLASAGCSREMHYNDAATIVVSPSGVVAECVSWC